MQTLLRIAFWTAAAGAFLLAALPHPPLLPHEPSDKVQHIVAFVVLAVLGAAAYPGTRTAKLLVGLCAFGALIELVQAIPQLHRDAELLDWLVDTAAASVVLGAIYLWRRRREPRP